MSRFTKKGRPPSGYEYIQPVMEALENELREKMNEPPEGRRSAEMLWPIHQINWQRSRYVYDLFYKYHKISREVYDYCIKRKLIDANLIAKWKKPGYEKLCSTHAINTKNFNFGTVSICRVPKHSLAPDTVVQEKHSGCRGCASGTKGQYNIFGNKYGQYLAAIQVAREKKVAKTEDNHTKTNTAVWVAEGDADDVDLAELEEEEMKGGEDYRESQAEEEEQQQPLKKQKKE